MTTMRDRRAPRMPLVLASAFAATLVLGGCAAGGPTPDGGSASASSTEQNTGMLADHGLDGLGARELIERLDTMPVADRPDDLLASVGQSAVLVQDASGRQASVPLPADEVYVSAAPYRQQTHDCHFHSLTTCLGELGGEDVRVTVTDRDSGEVVLDEQLRTFDNGFVGMWLPRGIQAELTISQGGESATTEVSTMNEDDPTCLTDLRLTQS